MAGHSRYLRGFCAGSRACRARRKFLRRSSCAVFPARPRGPTVPARFHQVRARNDPDSARLGLGTGFTHSYAERPRAHTRAPNRSVSLLQGHSRLLRDDVLHLYLEVLSGDGTSLQLPIMSGLLCMALTGHRNVLVALVPVSDQGKVPFHGNSSRLDTRDYIECTICGDCRA